MLIVVNRSGFLYHGSISRVPGTLAAVSAIQIHILPSCLAHRPIQQAQCPRHSQPTTETPSSHSSHTQSRGSSSPFGRPILRWLALSIILIAGIWFLPPLIVDNRIAGTDMGEDDTAGAAGE
ncbi:hypothetical protein BKA70DRAFT_1442739 [Coprinopsis sp. MPI-PUGE-AT-0042]|nr:hypothetical protein BKA70DRAFT_1442739 [Coprinopsis sp. MPI-PUGE-AT-0042]